jgi:L-lactate dehydrogenase complex protein LldG
LVAGALMAGGDAREVVLGRVRAALATGAGGGGRGGGNEGAGAAAAAPEIPRAYRQAGRAAQPDALVARFCERVGEYRAQVLRASPASLEGVVAGLLGARRVLVPAAPPCAARGFDAVGDDPPLAVGELDRADAVLTGCALAIAETGTVVLDGSASCGRRALTLVPDHHVCVVRASQIVLDVPDAVHALCAGDLMRRPITLVSGPSATSDIELERVEGVHGPRRLDVVVVVG